MQEYILTWKIENFSYCWQRTGESLNSPVFVTGPVKFVWMLILYPRGNDDSDYLALYLFRGKDMVRFAPEIDIEFSCISSDGSLLNTTSLSPFFSQLEIYGESSFIERYEIFHKNKALYLPDDVLKLQCKMTLKIGIGESEKYFGLTRLTTEAIISEESMNLANKNRKNILIRSNWDGRRLLIIDISCRFDLMIIQIFSAGLFMDRLFGENMKSGSLKLSVMDEKTKRKLRVCAYSFIGEPRTKCISLRLSDLVSSTKVDELVFETELVCCTGVRNFSISVSRINPDHQQTICTEFSKLYKERVLCDVELKTGDKSFFAHEIVLCARSSVFWKMLTSDMREKRSRRVEIEDISARTLETFLDFLYTDYFNTSEYDELTQLYYAADKYDVEKLKLLCCTNLLDSLEADDACDVLVLAHRHKDHGFKREVIQYILNNKMAVIQSPRFENFANNNIELFLEAMSSECKKKETTPEETCHSRAAKAPGCEADFESIYQHQILNDIYIKTTGATVPANKNVLSASSPLLMEKFTNDAINSPDCLEFQNWDEVTISQMLFFLYTDSLKDMPWETVIDLYKIANEYEINRLQIDCQRFLLENIQVCYVGDVLLLAYKYKDAHLKTAVQKFICLHDDEVFNSDEWASFSKSNLSLAYETIFDRFKKMSVIS